VARTTSRHSGKGGHSVEVDRWKFPRRSEQRSVALQPGMVFHDCDTPARLWPARHVGWPEWFR
jgi:hypothetical protein